MIEVVLPVVAALGGVAAGLAVAWKAIDTLGKGHAALLTQQQEAAKEQVRAQTASIDAVLEHIRKSTVVGGRPVDLERRALDLAEEKNRLEKQRMEIEKERLAQGRGSTRLAVAPMKRSPEGR